MVWRRDSLVSSSIPLTVAMFVNSSSNITQHCERFPLITINHVDDDDDDDDDIYMIVIRHHILAGVL